MLFTCDIQKNAADIVDLIEITDDARRFINTFTKSLISEYPLHIYISALQWTPMDSRLYQTYIHTAVRHPLPRVVRGFHSQWPLLV